MIERLDFNIELAPNERKEKLSKKFIHMLHSDELLKSKVKSHVDGTSVEQYATGDEITVNILEKINFGVSEYNSEKKSTQPSFKEIEVYDIIDHTIEHAIPPNYDLKSLKFGYYTDYHRNIVRLQCFWLREKIRFDENEKEKGIFTGRIKNEFNKEFRFTLNLITNNYANIIAKHEGVDQSIGFSGAFLWFIKPGILCGYWLGRDMLDFRPTIYQMFWSHDEISTKCLSELVKNVKIDALKGLGVNQSQLKPIKKTITANDIMLNTS